MAMPATVSLVVIESSSEFTPALGRLTFARAAAFSRSDLGLVVLALGAVALHVLDDNYVQPQPGTSAGDHLVSGLVPLALLAVAAAVYPRLRAGLRASLAMMLGAIGITFGVPGAYYLLHGSASGDHYSGLLAIVAGAVLLLSGPVTLWKARGTGGSRRRRYLRRTLTTATAVVAGLVGLTFLVFPVGYAYIYTHTGRTAVTPDLGVAYASVKVRTSDGLELAASYVPSKNRAAVILFPGATRSAQARMLIRHGYGVLLLDPRGQGRSEGDTVRWAGDRDLIGAVGYLRSRPDVDPDRIGGFGFSVGGELLLEAAAQSGGLKAVVSEGAGIRLGEGLTEGEGLSRLELALWNPASVVMTAAATVFSNHGPPPAIVDRIGRITPRAVYLIYADPGMGGEKTRQPRFFDAAGQPKAIWKVPGSAHTGGIHARPGEYERRVVGFFDDALLDPK
jgi:uncharacterized protein